MAGKPFDATTKELIENHPRDWLEFLGLPVNSITVTDADLSTVSPDADKMLVVDANPPFCKVDRGSLPGVIRQMEHQIDESAPSEAARLWTSTYILMGLRYLPEFAAQLLKGVRAMKESSTYQAILQEGRDEGEARGEAKGERNFLLRVGSKRFGEPDDLTVATIQAISSLELLDQLSDKLLEVESWAELLG